MVIFFIVGGQRSGTTLLRLILDSHPDITVYEEDTAYDRILSGKFVKDKNVGFKIPAWTFRHQFLKNLFPDAKFIFLKRDIKAVACSMLSLEIEGKEWVEIYGKDQIEKSICGISDLKKRSLFRGIFNELKEKNDFFLLAVLCAYMKEPLFEEYKKLGLDMLLVLYEELVRDPEKKIKEMVEFLAVPWNEQVMKHHEVQKGKWGGTEGKRAIDTFSLEKWKKFFSERDIERIEGFILDLEQRFINY